MSESLSEYAVSVEHVTDIERKLAVEIPWDRVKGKLDAAYQELGRGVSIKGFRRGKVPRRLLEQMFGQHVNKEVAQQLVQESIAKAVVDNDLSPVAEPKVDQEDIVDGEAFRYSALLQVLPEIDPKDYVGLEVPRRPARVSEHELELALERKQAEHTEYKPIEGRATAPGDVLLVDVMGKVDEEPVSLEGELVELGEKPREPFPGLAARLVGVDPSAEELELEFEVPAVLNEEGAVSVPARQARLLVSINDAKEKAVPELDDEFAKDTGEAETLAELKEKLRAQLLEADEERARAEAKEKLVAMVLERNDVPVVPALVERRLEQMSQFQQLLFGGQVDAADFRSYMSLEAERTVRSGLLVRAIAKKEAVEVDDADVEHRIAQMAAARGQNVPKVRAEFEKEGRLEQLRASILEEKTLDLLVSKSNLIIQEPADLDAATEPNGVAPEESSEHAK